MKRHYTRSFSQEDKGFETVLAIYWHLSDQTVIGEEATILQSRVPTEYKA
jgi:hypothetical protein